MPSLTHEVLVDMFRVRPTLAVEMLGGPLGVPVPAFERALLAPGDLTEIAPTEYRADTVVTLTADDSPVTSVVVEVQLRADPRKRRSWPAYVANLHARQGCPVYLLVVCPTQKEAAWCAVPIVVSDPGLTLTPVVLGPAQVPVVVDPEQARASPEATVLSAMAHGGRPDLREGVLGALLSVLDTVDHDHARLYADVVFTALPKAARDYLEAQMAVTKPYRYTSEFARRYFDSGRAEGEALGRAEGEALGRAEGEALGKAAGEAKAVLAVLAARGIDVPDHVHRDITACTDLDQLDTWIRRAVTVDKATDLFG